MVELLTHNLFDCGGLMSGLLEEDDEDESYWVWALWVYVEYHSLGCLIKAAV